MSTAGYRSMHWARLALLLTTALLITLAPAGATTLTPNGVDDTAQLQEALDACAGVAEPCTIDLAAGVFHTDALLAPDFRGEIRGRGMKQTTIRPVTDRPIRSVDEPFLDDPTIDEPYPVLMHFTGDSDVKLSDFTLEFPASMRVEAYVVVDPIENALLAAIMVDGTGVANLTVVRLAILAAKNDDLASFGSNVMNAIRFEGQIRLVDGEETATPLAGGEVIIWGTRVRNAGLGFALRDLTNVRATILNNRVQDARLIGIFLTDMGASHTLVANNRVAAEFLGVQILRGVRPHAEPSLFDILRNQFVVNEHGSSLFGPGDAILFLDVTSEDLENPGGIDRAFVFLNRIELGDAFDGVFVLGDRGNVVIARNEIAGSALDAPITIYGSRGTSTSFNLFTGAEPGRPDVWLADPTSECRVIEPKATVLDEGVNNWVEAKTVIRP